MYKRQNENLGTYGGKTVGDIYGATEKEQSTSTKYKTVYRSEEHTSELQSLRRISYAVFCLKKKSIFLWTFLYFLLSCEL